MDVTTQMHSPLGQRNYRSRRRANGLTQTEDHPTLHSGLFWMHDLRFTP